MKKHLPLRIISAALALNLIFSSTAQALTWQYTSAYDIGQGTTYYQVDGATEQGDQKIHYIEYTPNADVSPMIVYGSKLYGKSTIKAAVQMLQQEGKTVIAGINADFFDTSTGIPIGIIVNNGTYISSNANQYAVGFRADGSAVIGNPETTMTLSGQSGSVNISAFNKNRAKASITLLDTNFSAETRITSAGTNIIFERLDNNPVKMNGTVRLRVTDIQQVESSTPIGSNQMVLAISSEGPLSSIPDFAIGEEVTLTTITEDTAWNDVLFAVGGKTLLQNGEIKTADNPTGNNPRSAIGIKADGTVVIYEADGRQSGATGMTPSVLGQELLNLGCVNAINLDGGGSSAITVQQPGKSLEVVNSPSSGMLRSCANYIMLVNNAKATKTATKLHIYPEYKYILPGASMELSFTATDKNYYTANTPSDITCTVDNGMGTVENAKFTAGEQSGTATINAKSTSGATGTQNIYIIPSIDTLKISKADSSANIDNLKISAGTRVDLIAEATYKNLPVKTGGTAIKWQVSSPNLGSITADGVFTAKAGTGKITATYGSYTASLNVEVTMGNAEPTQIVADFETTTPFTDSDLTTVNLTKQYDQVHNGYQALAINYDFNENAIVELNIQPQEIQPQQKYIFAWIKGSENMPNIYAYFTDDYGYNKPLAVMQPTISQENGYTLYKAIIPDGYNWLTGLVLEQTLEVNGVLYLDNLMTSSTETADSTSPVIEFTKAPQNPAPGENVSIIASVIDNSNNSLDASQIDVYVDGTKIEFKANATNGNVAFDINNIESGLHRVTIKACDNWGNLSTKSTDVLCLDESATSMFSDIDGHWAANNITFLAKNGIMKGETTKTGENIFSPSRSLTRAEFAVMMTRYLNLDTNVDIELPFADVNNIPAWALDSIKAVYAAGIMNGSEVNGKQMFYPRENIVRREVMTVLSKSLPRGYANTTANFTDADKIPAWAAPHINYLVGIGVVSGYADGTFAPAKNITRAEIAKVLYNLY